MGPEYTPWIAPAIFATVIGIANYSIYMGTIDYMVAAYGPYASSATGGNGLARDLLGGIAQMYAGPLYDNIGGKFHYQWASTLLGCLAVLCTIPIYIFYWKGPIIRKKSKFAQEISREQENELEHLHPELAAARSEEVEKASRISRENSDTESSNDKV